MDDTKNADNSRQAMGNIIEQADLKKAKHETVGDNTWYITETCNNDSKDRYKQCNFFNHENDKRNKIFS
jgi:hypothetical protein